MRRISLSSGGCAAGLLLLATSGTFGQTLKVRPPLDKMLHK
jgi:hypothetical protein